LTAPVTARQLADAVTDRLLEASPFTATSLGLRDYDALLPDASRAAEDALSSDLAELAAQAERVVEERSDDGVTVAVARSTCETVRLDLANRAADHTVTAMPIAGPPLLFSVLARTVLVDPQAAEDYLERLRGAPDWVDASTQRLAEGSAAGRRPVGTLVDQALAWADRAVAAEVPAAVLEPRPPDGWDGTTAWQESVEEAARAIRAAVGRWREALVEQRPHARDDDHPGVVHLPDGETSYARSIAVHTTLPLSADQIHQRGLEAVAELEERLLSLGAGIGLSTLEEIRAAARGSAELQDAESALAAALAAVRRAEARASELMPGPLPDPCAVEPMAATVAESGIAPHYTRPRMDGGRPGTYWFNTMRPTAGTGWDLEVVAFHEAVPGHHSQLARLQHLPDLPLLQQLGVTAHGEGWGLYAERLAGEHGLYSDVRAEIGAAHCELHRAVRLVVDTGLHAHGWSRSRAIDYVVGRVAMPEPFLVNEVDRYIAWPGQALAYLVGLQEILRLRTQARAALGDAFDLRGFHAAVLDSGFLPLPVLDQVVTSWAGGLPGGSALSGQADAPEQ
jgi:uncharacterized protein (DUF885 family)